MRGSRISRVGRRSDKPWNFEEMLSASSSDTVRVGAQPAAMTDSANMPAAPENLTIRLDVLLIFAITSPRKNGVDLTADGPCFESDILD